MRVNSSARQGSPRDAAHARIALALRRSGPFLCLLIGFGASGAGAVELAPAAAPALPTLATFNWSGVYAGLQVGYDDERDRLVELATGSGVPTGSRYAIRAEGLTAGGHLGVDTQIGSVVLGLVTDFEGTTDRGTFLDPTGVGRGQDRIPWQGSVRARAGWAYGPLLAYATGGFAYAGLNATYVYVPTVTRERFSRVMTGWTLGGGLEYAFTARWSASVEYRHTDYGAILNKSVVAFPGLTGRADVQADAVRLGVSYRF